MTVAFLLFINDVHGMGLKVSTQDCSCWAFTGHDDGVPARLQNALPPVPADGEY